MVYCIERGGGKHPTERRTATKSLMNITILSTDRHVSELWLFQIFLECAGYQLTVHFKIVAMNNSYNFMHASWSNIEQ